MAFTLHPITIEDAEDMGRIFRDAFQDDHIIGRFYPNTPKDVRCAQDLEFFRGLIKDGDLYGGRFTKVVETSTGCLQDLLC